MKRASSLSTACLVLGCTLAPAACDDAPLRLPREPFAVGEGRFRLQVDGQGSTLRLQRDHTTLLTLEPSAFQLGVVEETAADRSWDPIEIDRRGDADSGVTFRSPIAWTATLTSTAARDAEIDLDYGDGLSAKISIAGAGAADPSNTPSTAARAASRFVLTLAPNDTEAGRPTVALARVRVRTSGDVTEGLYGLGEQLDSVDNRGKLRAMQLEADGEVESTSNEAHVPVPLLVGTHGWAMFVPSTRVGAFDVARKDPSYVEATFAVASTTGGSRAEALRVDLLAADAPMDLYREYYSASGVPRPPPIWALGPWIWRNESKDQAEVESDLEQIRALDLATTGIWIDRPYARAVNTFDFDPARYTDAQAMINRAKSAGFHVALWSTPYLEDAAEPLKGEATQRGFFPREVGILLNKWGAPIDFTSPDASAYWRGLVQRYTAMGIDGFKLDYAEDVVPSIGAKRNVWRFSDGSDERTMHHRYSGLYHRVYSDAASGREPGASAPNVGLPFLLVRAAHWGEQTQGVIVWPGDMDATFTQYRERFTARSGEQVTGVGGLPATVVMGLSLSASGFPFFAADTGGYRHSPPDKELFVRWAEQTALSTVMEVGDGSSQPPWLFTPENGRDQEALDIYRTYARLHMRLFPYEWTYAVRMTTDGKPIQRPLGLAYPELGVHPSDEYMFGDDLLVAPVVVRGQTRRRVIVPKGTWFDYWDATPYTPDASGAIDVDAPLAKLPLLLREGAIVPLLRPTIDTLAPVTDDGIDSFARDPGPLWVLLAPGRSLEPRRFDLWEGASIARLADGSIEVKDGAAFDRGFVLEMIARSEPTEIVRDEGLIPHLKSEADLQAATKGWTWTSARRGTLFVKLPAGDARVTIR